MQQKEKETEGEGDRKDREREIDSGISRSCTPTAQDWMASHKNS